MLARIIGLVSKVEQRPGPGLRHRMPVLRLSWMVRERRRVRVLAT
jgi:hypothetical protein